MACVPCKIAIVNPEKVWIIEQHQTRSEYGQKFDFVRSTIEKWLTYYRQERDSVAERRNLYRGREQNMNWKKIREDGFYNQLQIIQKAISNLQEFDALVTMKSAYREWTPLYAFRPVRFVPDLSYCYAWGHDVVVLPTYQTTLERCVALWNELTPLMKEKEMRVRNTETGETIPCELFG